jgi:hypothetical protein
MTTVVGIGIIYGAPTQRCVLASDAIILIFLYTSLIITLYRFG